MKKKIKEVMSDYIYRRSVNSSSTSDRDTNCYILGYIDGYFDENIYKTFLEKDSDYDSYSKGESDGIKDREREIEKDLSGYKKEKVEWIEKLAIHDMLNKEINRDFKTEDIDYRSDKLFHIFKSNEVILRSNSIKLCNSDLIYVRNYINDRKTR